MSLFLNSSYLVQENKFQQADKETNRQSCNFSICNAPIFHAGDIQAQWTAGSAQVQKLSLNNIAYYYGHRQTTQKDQTQNILCKKDINICPQVLQEDGVISLLMPRRFFDK